MITKHILILSSILFFMFYLTGCNQTNNAGNSAASPETIKQGNVPTNQQQIQAKQTAPLSLPVNYQTPSYMVDFADQQPLVAEAEEASIKVGATIRSTRGPQPLWDILKRLAALKKMNVSWASDVDQKVLVDVDISADDDFYQSIANLLRQVDYFHEVEGKTIVVKYKETRRYHIAMPFTKSTYGTGTGGNVLGSDAESSNIDGTISLKSDANEFDIWANIQANMDAIINTWNTQVTALPSEEVTSAEDNEEETDTEQNTQLATRQLSSGGSMYIIDKPVGMITVTAPRPLLERLEKYFTALKKELYKQITIEAKIIEVQLNDSSSIGVNWSDVLKNFAVNGTMQFGYNGQVYPYVSANDLAAAALGNPVLGLDKPGRFVSRVAIDRLNFTAFLNALKENGDTRILSNPKISVMNGQPALITVGRNVTYVDSIESELDSDTGIVTYTVETERILSGLGMALTATVLDDHEIIMNLVPVTSELVEPIEYRQVGSLGAVVGLPIVNVREMSTTVKVTDGEMLIIGGLISNINESKGEFAPGVGNVPLLKYLFGHEEKTKKKRELIILLKPRII